MLIQESIKRQEQLKQCLYDMASKSMEDDEVESIIIKLQEIYSNNFRHNYSMFFPIIIDVAKEGNSLDLDFLSNNIDRARALVEEDYLSAMVENIYPRYKGLYRPLSKLSDHINMEIARYNYYLVNNQKTTDLEQKNQELQNKIETASGELKLAKVRVEKVQTELIAVLSIFAAVVITFSGSFSFIGQALIGMNSSPFFKSVFFVLLCGVVVFNTIFVMMYTVSKITGRSIYTRCKNNDCEGQIDGKEQCSGIKRIIKRMPYVFWVNVLIIGLMVLDILFWIVNTHFPFMTV